MLRRPACAAHPVVVVPDVLYPELKLCNPAQMRSNSCTPCTAVRALKTRVGGKPGMQIYLANSLAYANLAPAIC